MDAPKPRTGDAGFSLIELLVAMFITLIISGAIFGLMTSTQTAFRREPELAERQQSIRVAMDLIERDIAAAGQGLPYFVQAFTATDDAAGPCAAGLDGCGPGGGVITAGALSDALEVLATEDQCPLLTVCDAPNPGAAGTVTTNEVIPGCMGPLGQPTLVAFTDRVFWRIQPATPGVGGGACPGGAANGSVATLAPLAFTGTPALPAGVPGAAGIVQLGAARIARYEVGVDPVDGAPALWRSATGYFDTAGGPVGPPPQAVGDVPGGTWQLVARGVEDMQVQYLDGVGAAADPDTWVDSPPAAATCATALAGSTSPPPTGCVQVEADTLVRQVRVTLSARSMAVGLQGQNTGADGSQAVRGRLVGVTAPRAALIALQFQNQFMR